MARHLFGLLGKAAALGLAALAAGCSTFVSQTTQPTENVTAIYSWHAKGNMVFTCAYDAEGAYWRFLKPEGALYDESGRKQADLLADFGIRARDGSRITARIVKQTDTDDARNLKPALFETSGARNSQRHPLCRAPFAKGGHAACRLLGIATRQATRRSFYGTLYFLSIKRFDFSRNVKKANPSASAHVHLFERKTC